jgi:hypothetical protein
MDLANLFSDAADDADDAGMDAEALLSGESLAGELE